MREIEPFLREEWVVEIKGKRYAFRCMGKDNKPLFMPSLGENGDVNLMMEKELNGKYHTHHIVTDMMDITRPHTVLSPMSPLEHRYSDPRLRFPSSYEHTFLLSLHQVPRAGIERVIVGVLQSAPIDLKGAQ